MADGLVTIEGKVREGRGKGAARRLRREGLIPANLMVKNKAIAIELNPKYLSKAWKADRKFNLTLDGTTKVVRIHELQVHPVRREPLHVDLMYTE